MSRLPSHIATPPAPPNQPPDRGAPHNEQGPPLHSPTTKTRPTPPSQAPATTGKGHRPPPSNSTHTQKRSPRISPPLPFFQPLTIINYNINGIKFVPHSNPSPYWLIIFMHHLTNIAFNGSIYR